MIAQWNRRRQSCNWKFATLLMLGFRDSAFRERSKVDRAERERELTDQGALITSVIDDPTNAIHTVPVDPLVVAERNAAGWKQNAREWQQKAQLLEKTAWSLNADFMRCEHERRQLQRLVEMLDTNIDSDQDELLRLWRDGRWREVWETWKSEWEQTTRSVAR